MSYSPARYIAYYCDRPRDPWTGGRAERILDRHDAAMRRDAERLFGDDEATQLLAELRSILCAILREERAGQK